MNTTYFINQIMGNVFKTQTNPSLPSAFYIGLTGSAPTPDGLYSGEPSGANSGYERVQLTNLSAPVNGIITNTAALSFNESTSNWGEMSYYIVCDAAKEGNLLFYGALTPSRVVEENTVITIGAGELNIKLSNPS